MADNLVDLGPWPLGINMVDSPRAPAFQPPSSPGDKPAQLLDALNVDLDRNGFITRRAGRTLRIGLTNGHSGDSVGGLHLLVDDGVLYEVNASLQRTALASDVGPGEMSYVAVGDRVYWLNGSACGCLQDHQNTPWGLASCDAPSLSAVSGGGLVPGRYGVAITCRPDATGIESGCRSAEYIEVSANASILVNPLGIDAQATVLEVYMTTWNGDVLYWYGTYPANSVIVLDRPVPSLYPLDRMGLYPPPLGQLAELHSGRMLIAKDNVLYWSEAQRYHLFNTVDNFRLFPSRIVLLVSVNTGFFIACEDGPTWFVQGADPAEWRPKQIASCPACEGRAIRIPGHKLPWMQTQEVVPVWATSEGIAGGHPDGVVLFPQSGRVVLDTNKKATLAFREEEGLRQILLAAREKSASTQFGMGVKFSTTVIKADGTIQ